MPFRCSFVIFPHPSRRALLQVRLSPKGLSWHLQAWAWVVPELAPALGAQAELLAEGRSGRGAGVGDGFCFGDEVKQDTAALLRDLAATAPG